nr:hypothetical protein [Psychrobacillus glaciei]
MKKILPLVTLAFSIYRQSTRRTFRQTEAVLLPTDSQNRKEDRTLPL